MLGRDKIVKFEGCYHGHADSLLVKAGSGALTPGPAHSPGVPADFAKHTSPVSITIADRCARPSPSTAADRLHHSRAGGGQHESASRRSPASWKGCAPSATNSGALLILDEVMTGFRVSCAAPRPLQHRSGPHHPPGKIIGAGMPVGAFGGKKKVMQHIAPTGPVYQAGTLSGNPVASGRRPRHAGSAAGTGSL